jgi:hypothetical protein
MPERTCPCGTPVEDTFICSKCEWQLRVDLGDQESHRRELLTALTRQVRMAPPPDGGRGDNSPALTWKRIGDRRLDTISRKELDRLLARLPPARPAADTLHAQQALLTSWCRLLADLGYGMPPGPGVQALSLHLERHLDALRNHEAAPDLRAEVRDLVARVWRVIDTPENRVRLTLGPCPQDDDSGDPCVGEVVATLPWDDRLPISMQCTACKAVWDRDPEELRTANNRIRYRMGLAPILGSLQLFTVKEAAMLGQVKEQRLRRAIKAGKVPALKESEHKTLVRIEDVISWRDGQPKADSPVSTDRNA